MTDRYIVAVKREARKSVSANWVDRILQIDGVEIVGSGSTRVQITATPEAIKILQGVLGEDFRIEPAITHRPLTHRE